MVKKYYWLKLKEDFFDDETIKYIEEQENGIKYSNFYLKLCLKSLRTEGVLIRLIGETLIPYDAPALAKLTGVDTDTVICAMNLFTKIGLIKILETGEIFLSQINEMVGSETDKASMMRRLRAKEKLNGNNVTQMLPKCYPEIEKDIEKDIDIEKDVDIEKDKILKTYEENLGLLTPASAEIIYSYLDTFNEDVVCEAIKKASIANKRSTKYVIGILNDWKKKNIKTLIDIENEENNFRNKKTNVNETEEEKTQRKIKELEEAFLNGD